MNLRLTSSAFNEDAPIPAKYTHDGKNVSPPLQWEEAPLGVKSFVLIVDDPDAPSKTWVHWVLYNIPATTKQCAEGMAPVGALQGMNDFGDAAYGGPSPPSGVHRYFFKLYALDKVLALPAGAQKHQVEAEMKGHILAQGQLMGTYTRQTQRA